MVYIHLYKNGISEKCEEIISEIICYYSNESCQLKSFSIESIMDGLNSEILPSKRKTEFHQLLTFLTFTLSDNNTQHTMRMINLTFTLIHFQKK